MTNLFDRIRLIRCVAVVAYILLAASRVVTAEVANEHVLPSPSDLPLDSPIVESVTESPLDEASLEDVSEMLDASLIEPTPEEPPLTFDLFAPKTFYRRSTSFTSWLPANSDELGWLSLNSDPHLKATESSGITSGFAIHWLNGPIQTDLPPRLYNFHVGLQARKQVSPGFSYDLASSISIASDFEDSARDGIQFPSHAVGFLHANCNVDVALGVEYLHRDDIKILPVFGIVLRDPSTGIRAELVFPRPRIDFQLNPTTTFFVNAELGGGSWDIERPDESNDVFTYRDYRITVGLDTVKDDGKMSAIEFGYVFRRQLEFRHSPMQLSFDDAFVVRFVERF